MVKPSTSRLIREALLEGPKCIWEIYQYVKSKPAHYKRRISYRSIYNMLYVLWKLGLVRRLPKHEAERMGLSVTGGIGKVRPRYARTYYILINCDNEAWNNPYKAYSSILRRRIKHVSLR